MQQTSNARDEMMGDSYESEVKISEASRRSSSLRSSCFSLKFTTFLALTSATFVVDSLPVVAAQIPSQSVNPSVGPSILPSMLPSLMPSSHPSTVPSTRPPSFAPSDGPTPLPTLTTIPSHSPSAAPTMNPTRTAYPSNSPLPSQRPSFRPSQPPTHPPSMVPSTSPTDTFWPSHNPSASALPSDLPTESPAPTASPSSTPTRTAHPTGDPSVAPSNLPTFVPSDSPTIAPTFDQPFASNNFYFQTFRVDNGRVFNDFETLSFQAIMEGYTQNISSPVDSDWTRINSSCVIINQRFVSGRRLESESSSSSLRRRRLEDGGGDADDTNLPNNFVDYTMSWSSIHVNVTTFSTKFFDFINVNLDSLTDDLQAGGLNVSRSTRARIIKTTDPPSVMPTVSWVPSTAPSLIPTSAPSEFPSDNPSLLPTPLPTATPTIAPSVGPSAEGDAPDPTMPPVFVPTQPSNPEPDGANTTIIVVVVVGVILVGLAGAYIYFRRRTAKRELAFQTAAAAGGGTAIIAGNDRHGFNSSRLSIKADLYGGTRDGYGGDTPRSDDQAGGMISPSESLLSNQSLLSAGVSMGVESVEEPDGTHHLADEFDQYKDQNLEKMRTDVEDTVTGADGMMSHALTLALMGDEDPVADQKELYWGGSGDATEIEASALCEVNDFLKRKDGAGLAERRTFMQETMNKMVASVRHGVMKPDEASRTIHECAAMLGLELASDIPENTVIVTGMRKNVTKSDLEVAFREFGDIDDAAVASMGRGLGLVRFVSTASVNRCMQKFRAKEIVVQDVAIMVKVLKADGVPFNGEQA